MGNRRHVSTLDALPLLARVSVGKNADQRAVVQAYSNFRRTGDLSFCCRALARVGFARYQQSITSKRFAEAVRSS